MQSTTLVKTGQNRQKIGDSIFSLNPLYYVVPSAGLEPASRQTTASKAAAFTGFATRAWVAPEALTRPERHQAAKAGSCGPPWFERKTEAVGASVVGVPAASSLSGPVGSDMRQRGLGAALALGSSSDRQIGVVDSGIARIIAMGWSGNQPDKVTAAKVIDAVRKSQAPSVE